MTKHLPLLSLCFTLTALPIHAATIVKPFFKSHSFSNILPVKQLIEDDWKQAPERDSNIGFTQNEVGIATYWNNIYLSASHRYDYMVRTNSDTAKAFYLDRNKQPLNTQSQYDASLHLLHQRSNGLRIGYRYEGQHFSSEIRMGYWHVNASRESRLTGTISSDLNGNIAANATLSEFYSENNFLKRQNTDDWDTDGSGITVDVYLSWQPTNNIKLALDLTDIYSDFKLDNTGFSEGIIDTDGTFINSIGGVAYVPLYRGRETSAEHQFKLPKTINIDSVVTLNDTDYVAHFTRQGDVNFYYLGMQFNHNNFNTRVLFDVENKAPEIQLSNKWMRAYFSMDDVDIDKAMLLKLGINFHVSF